MQSINGVELNVAVVNLYLLLGFIGLLLAYTHAVCATFAYWFVGVTAYRWNQTMVILKVILAYFDRCGAPTLFLERSRYRQRIESHTNH